MKKQHSIVGFLFVGFGLYFLLHQLNIPFLTPFYSWPTLLIIIGGTFLIQGYLAKDSSNLFIGSLFLSLGAHFLAVDHFSFWNDHWGVYPLIGGIAFLFRYQQTKSGLIPALLLTGIGLFAIIAPSSPRWFKWIQDLFLLLEQFWPIVIIAFGFYLLRKK